MQHVLQQRPVGVADVHRRVAFFVTVLAGQRDSALAVDQTGDIGSINGGKQTGQLSGDHPWSSLKASGPDGKSGPGIGGGGGTAGSIPFDMGRTIPSPAVTDRGGRIVDCGLIRNPP